MERKGINSWMSIFWGNFIFWGKTQLIVLLWNVKEYISWMSSHFFPHLFISFWLNPTDGGESVLLWNVKELIRECQVIFPHN